MPPLKIGVLMIDKIKNTMRSCDIFPKKAVLIGLSGGADSVALTDVMHKLSQEYGFRVYAAHINHGLREDKAIRDEKFSAELCDKLGIRLFIKRADIRKYSKEHGISEEMAGREVRYGFFAELMDKYGIEYTATAHHKNDNAETLLMNFMRGSTGGGLCGIPYKRDRYIRPLLDVKRSEIEKYCSINGLSYVTDETNLDTVYTRNKIRNILIPEIEERFNPNFVDTVTANANLIRDDEDFLDSVAQTEYLRIVTGGGADIAELVKLHKAVTRRIIRKMIADKVSVTDISSKTVDGIYDICKKGTTGLSYCIVRNIIARCEYGKLIMEENGEEYGEFSYTLPIGEEIYIPQLGYSVLAEYALKRESDNAQYFKAGADCEITVTNRRKGDKFQPAGMCGHKLVKDYMVNEKIPKKDRSRTGILRINGEIAWIIGYRRDDRFKFEKTGIKITIK